MELLNIDATVEDCEHFIRSLAIDDSVYQNSDCSAILTNLMLCDRVIGWDRLSLIYCNARRNKLALNNETKGF